MWLAFDQHPLRVSIGPPDENLIPIEGTRVSPFPPGVQAGPHAGNEAGSLVRKRKESFVRQYSRGRETEKMEERNLKSPYQKLSWESSKFRAGVVLVIHAHAPVVKWGFVRNKAWGVKRNMIRVKLFRVSFCTFSLIFTFPRFTGSRNTAGLSAEPTPPK